jgi:hypothetical protein
VSAEETSLTLMVTALAMFRPQISGNRKPAAVARICRAT